MATTRVPHPSEIVFFSSPEEFRAWLEANHATATELWMGLRKKHVQPRGLTWEQAVPEALCFGWIDSVVYSMGPDAVRQRWTVRIAEPKGPRFYRLAKGRIQLGQSKTHSFLNRRRPTGIFRGFCARQA